jgi:hypothetical protein
MHTNTNRSRDRSTERQRHELGCLQRWFIIQDFMKIKGVDHVFFGDGDSSVFADMSLVHSYRPSCDAVINIESQSNNLHWVGAGEASIWTIAGISDFCKFTTAMYKSFVPTLKIKARGGSSVVDMSIMWLWWVAHHKQTATGWETGRPYGRRPPLDSSSASSASSASLLFDAQREGHPSDRAMDYCKTLQLPKVDMSLRVCNGMYVVNRTCMDHMHGWNTGNGFSLDLDGDGRPYIIGASLANGGRPESLSTEDLKRLHVSKLYLNNIHYQVQPRCIQDDIRVHVHTCI